MLKYKFIFIGYHNGLGNNLFQYFAAKFYAYKPQYKIIIINLPSFTSKGPNFIFRMLAYFLLKTFNHIDDSMLENDNVNLKLFNIFIGYGEIPKLFIKKKNLIEKEFNKNIFLVKKPTFLSKRSYNVVLHLRLGDRFLNKTNYLPNMYYDFEKLKIIINNIKSKKNNTKFYLVTDFKELQNKLTYKKFKELSFHITVPKEEKIKFSEAKIYLNQINNFIDVYKFKVLKNTTIKEDFSIMYYSNTLIFLHGTLAWWAGFLGNQDEVFVSKYWRPHKNESNSISLTKNIDSRWKAW